MMKQILAVAAVIGLAACGGAGGGGGAKARLVSACVADGEDKAMCECTVNAMADLLSNEDLAKLAEYAEKKDDAAAQQLVMSKVMGDTEKMTKFGETMAACTQ